MTKKDLFGLITSFHTILVVTQLEYFTCPK